MASSHGILTSYLTYTLHITAIAFLAYKLPTKTLLCISQVRTYKQTRIQLTTKYEGVSCVFLALEVCDFIVQAWF